MKNSFITEIDFDKDLTEGANNAINVCLRLKPEERITIITDNDSLEIASSLVNEIKKVGSEYSLMIIEDYTPRPTPNMPKQILDDLAKSQVSIFCAQAQTGELSSRIQMTAVVNSKKITTWSYGQYQQADNDGRNAS